MIPTDDLIRLGLPLSATLKEVANDPVDRSHLLGTPQSGAVRPNFELWPHIEAEISDTFRLYAAALFLYRAIHLEIAGLDHASVPFFTSDFFTRVRKKRSPMHRASHDVKHECDWFMEGRDETTAEGLAIDVLQSDDIRRYLGNLQGVLGALANRVDVEGKLGLADLVINNIRPLLADADYLIGILRDCSDRAARAVAEIPKLTDFALRAKHDDFSTVRKRRADYFLRTRHAMTELIAKSLADTIVDKVESLCRMRGWTVSYIE
jgi:hypothetical protein